MLDVDHGRMAILYNLLGEDQLLVLGEQLAQALANITSLLDANLDYHVHRLIGSAGSLGFPTLAKDLASFAHGAQEISRLASEAPHIVPTMKMAIHAFKRQQ